MKIGLQIPNFSFPNGPEGFSKDISEIVKLVDKGGFTSLWVMDHFFQIGQKGGLILGPAEDDMYEAYTLLGFFAGLTKNVKLGTLVTGNIYRNPGVLTKAVTTLDIISKGRAYLGIGAGWMQREAEAFGIPFNSFKERFEKLEEALQIIKQMWSDNDGGYKGKHYTFKETMCHPMPITKPHPPILIGGMGPKKTLRFVAKYANATNLFTGGGIAPVENALKTLRKHCEDVGRNYEDIEKTTLGSTFLGREDVPDSIERDTRYGKITTKHLKTAEQVIDHVKDLHALGIDHAIFNMRDPFNLSNIDTFKDEIIPAIEDL